MGGQMINVGGHFLSKESGLNFVGIHPGKGAPVPPPKPGSKGTGAPGGAGDAEGLGGSEHGKAGKGEGASDWSPLKGWYNLWAFLRYFFLRSSPFNAQMMMMMMPSLVQIC